MHGYKSINNILINSEILSKKFTCDLSKCKGACCTLKSDFGAPLNWDEISKIEKVLPLAKKYLSERNIKEIENNGFWEVKHETFLTRSINKRDCVFVYWENEIAKCALEKAYLEDKTDFIKPISCHLFPIRVTNFGGKTLKYEEYLECKPALELGEKTNLTVAEFLKTPLQREFGDDFFKKLTNQKDK
jgi:hypothetical protein